LSIDGQSVSGIWTLERGPLYKIDSISVTGTAKISNSFLQQYLDIPNGSLYKKEKLDVSQQAIVGIALPEGNQ
jgi:outer membrane translocation and assembly module TamA